MGSGPAGPFFWQARSGLLVLTIWWCAVARAAPASKVTAGGAVPVEHIEGQRKSARSIFKRLDVNNDGTLTIKELEKQTNMAELVDLLHGIPATTAMALSDENSDTLLDRREYTNWLVDRMMAEHEHAVEWEKSDADEDGELSFGEYMSSPMGEYAMHAPTGCPADFNPGPADTMCKSRPRSGVKTARARFQSLDRDGDGVVSHQEFSVHTSPDAFLAADRNQDGIIEKDEYMKAPRHWRAFNHRDGEEIESEFDRMDKNLDGKITRQEFEDDVREQRRLNRGRIPVGSSGEAEDGWEQYAEDGWVAFTESIIAPNEQSMSQVPLKQFKNADRPVHGHVSNVDSHQKVFKLPTEDVSPEPVLVGQHAQRATSEERKQKQPAVYEIEADVVPL